MGDEDLKYDPNLNIAVRSILQDRNESFEAKQELLIYRKIEEHYEKYEDKRRGRMQFWTAIGGVSILALVAILYENVERVAKESSRNAVQEAVQTVDRAKEKLEEEYSQYDDLKNSIAKTSSDVDDLRESAKDLINEVKGTLLDVNKALANIHAVEGELGISQDLSRIYREIDNIRRENLALKRDEDQAQDQTQDQDGGRKIINILPAK